MPLDGVGTAWKPQYRDDGSRGPQFALLSCPFTEIFFGGARGGGKTSGMLGHWLAHAQRYGDKARGAFFRRRFTQLKEVQRQASALFPLLGATYSKSEKTWKFPNGATLYLGYLWDEQDADAYQGWSLTWICFEELTQWPDLSAMNKMRGTLRSSDGVKCMLLATGNPGGPGHQAVKSRYIDPAPSGFTPIIDTETGETRVFIPSRLNDNLALVRNDPNYGKRLMALGNSQLVKAWLYGDWAVTFGGLLDDLWVPDCHVLRPFTIPSGWTARRAFDWGSSRPSALLMFAISDGSPVAELGGRVFPRGSMILFSEWYTVAKDGSGNVKPNEGLRLTNQALGHGIADRSRDRQWSGCVADPAIFTEMGRESIYAEIKAAAAERSHVLMFNKANNDRVGGWQKMRDMIENAAADRPEKPGLWVFNTCVNFLRTVPTLQRDDNRPDDVDTDQEDHAADACRYAINTAERKMVVGELQRRHMEPGLWQQNRTRATLGSKA